MLESIQNITLANWGSFASIGGLVITLFTLFLVSNIRKTFMLRARLSDLHDELARSTSTISSLLNNYENNEDDIEKELATAAVTLRNTARKATNPLKSDAKKALRMIKWCRRRWLVRFKWIRPDEKSIRKIYIELSSVGEEMKNHQKDMTWSN